MERRHEDQMRAVIERVQTHGVAEVLKSEIRLWFGQDRVGRRTWRQIAQMWRETSQDISKHKMLVGGLDTEHWYFVYAYNAPTNAASYLKDVRYLAGEVNPEGLPVAIPEDGEE